MPPSALLFDLDGTLVDSKRDLAKATNLLLEELGFQAIDLETVCTFVGRGARALVRRALNHADPAGTVSADDPRLRHFLGHYQSVMLATTTPFPGVMGGLESLRAAGIPMAIVTNKPEAPAREVLAGLGMTEFFGVIYGGDTLPTRKPEPDMLVQAAADLGVSLEGAWMVGDSDVDIDAAHAAGVPGVWCSWGGFHPERPHNADQRVDVFSELVAMTLGRGIASLQ
ncbi:MAG: phosphoglycolate phosphatase [Deltaproteobacteria bacterium]|nr:phosphoglycolate phosphatase [Deltaproteobacteria bacterium]